MTKKYLRYYGEFTSVGDHMIRVAIYQDAETPFTPIELDFPADSPLVIEYGEKEKYDVILGSSATLKVLSNETLRFDDLYTVKYGTIRLDVWRDGKFFWTGCIDTMQYEENYETWHSEVALTFSDFSELDRIPFDMEIGFKSIKEIIAQALYKTQCVRSTMESDFDDSFEYSTWVQNIDWSAMLLGTTYQRQITSGLASIVVNVEVVQNAYVRTDNFYDETGTPKKWSEVITGILQPLGVRLMQKNGMLYLYDLDSLYKADNDMTDKMIYWTADHQEFSIDKTYNNVTVTWSPYAQVSNTLPDSCWDESYKTDSNQNALNEQYGKEINNSLVFSYPLDSQTNTQYADGSGTDYVNLGFSLWTNTHCSNITLGSNYRVFKIVPHYDGEDADGVAVYWRGEWGITAISDAIKATYTQYQEHGFKPLNTWGEVQSVVYQANPVKLFTTQHIIISPQSSETPMQLRLKMPVLFDCKPNPFEEPWGWWDDNNAMPLKALEHFNNYAQFLYIPCRICFKPTGSEDIYYYDNSHVMTWASNVTSFIRTLGYWKKNDYNNRVCWLAYYKTDADERNKGTATCSGFVYNRQTINNHGQSLSTQMINMEDGQYIRYPDIEGKGGELWIEVCAKGWMTCKCGYDLRDGNLSHKVQATSNSLAMALCGLPELEIINCNEFDQDLSNEDVIYKSEVNRDAYEELALDTICGTYVGGIPTARGAYFKDDGTQMKEMKRADREAEAETLLCGTLYSQYAERHVCLSGECQITDSRCLSFKETHQGNKKFLCVSESMDLRTDCADAKFIEFNPDEYTQE